MLFIEKMAHGRKNNDLQEQNLMYRLFLKSLGFEKNEERNVDVHFIDILLTQSDF